MSDGARPTPPAATSPVISLRTVSYRLPGGRVLLDALTLDVARGETLVLLGRSGSGKTTTMRLVNRLLEPSAGEVLVEGRATSQWDAIKLRRHIGYVIQETGLFPHFTIERNIALVPSLEGWAPDRVRARVAELMELVGLPSEMSARYPRQLSGGQRQRVGVARALAADPPILLMDEPFGALDPITRADLQNEFRALQRRLAKTILFVTHDLREALVLGDRIALLEGGRLMGLYTPAEFLRADEPLAAAYLAAFRAGDPPGAG